MWIFIVSCNWFASRRQFHAIVMLYTEDYIWKLIISLFIIQQHTHLQVMCVYLFCQWKAIACNNHVICGRLYLAVDNLLVYNPTTHALTGNAHECFHITLFIKSDCYKQTNHEHDNFFIYSTTSQEVTWNTGVVCRGLF